VDHNGNATGEHITMPRCFARSCNVGYETVTVKGGSFKCVAYPKVTPPPPPPPVSEEQARRWAAENKAAFDFLRRVGLGDYLKYWRASMEHCYGGFSAMVYKRPGLDRYIVQPSCTGVPNVECSESGCGMVSTANAPVPTFAGSISMDQLIPRTPTP
jgi:hypothetical protein